MPVPFMFTDAGVSFLQTGYSRSQFDLSRGSDGKLLSADISCSCPEGDVPIRGRDQRGDARPS